MAIPYLKTVEDVERAVENLPYAARSERASITEACKTALADLAALGKADQLKVFHLQQDLQRFQK